MREIISVFAFLFGAVFASFAGVVAYRVPKGLSIVKPDSYCPSCKRDIASYDNIPILSYLILGGKCRYCKAKIGVMSLILEILGGLGFMLAYLAYGSSLINLPIVIGLCCLVFLFIIMAAIDYETHYVYNVTLWIFAALTFAMTLYRVFVLDKSIWDYVGGAAIGFGFFITISFVAKFILKREALGSGDTFIVGIGGFLVGAFPLILSLLVGCLIGSIIELIKIKLKASERDDEIAFAPYLLLGIATIAIFGEEIMRIYLEVLL